MEEQKDKLSNWELAKNVFKSPWIIVGDVVVWLVILAEVIFIPFEPWVERVMIFMIVAIGLMVSLNVAFLRNRWWNWIRGRGFKD